MAEIDNVINNAVTQEIEKQTGPRNRAERRALEKRNRHKIKQKKYFIDSMKDYTTKMAYIDLIQKLRKINEENEKNGNDNIDTE